jgi:hypothetical protein
VRRGCSARHWLRRRERGFTASVGFGVSCVVAGPLSPPTACQRALTRGSRNTVTHLAGTEAGHYESLRRGPGRRPAATSFGGRRHGASGRDGDWVLRSGGPLSPPLCVLRSGGSLSPPTACERAQTRGSRDTVTYLAGTETGRYESLRRGPGRRPATTSSCGMGRDGGRPLRVSAGAGMEHQVGTGTGCCVVAGLCPRQQPVNVRRHEVRETTSRIWPGRRPANASRCAVGRDGGRPLRGRRGCTPWEGEAPAEPVSGKGCAKTTASGVRRAVRMLNEPRARARGSLRVNSGVLALRSQTIPPRTTRISLRPASCRS